MQWVFLTVVTAATLGMGWFCWWFWRELDLSDAPLPRRRLLKGATGGAFLAMSLQLGVWVALIAGAYPR